MKKKTGNNTSSAKPTMSVFYCCSHQFPQTSSLEQHIYYLVFGGGHKSDWGLSGLRSRHRQG